MEQRIAFCTTGDGVCIAHATVGSGEPAVLYVAGWPAHLEMEWARASSRAFIETLAAGATLVRYDMRGCGLSDHDVADVSLDALMGDLDAVVAASGFTTFALLGLGMLASPIALSYAAAHPERVSRIVLASAFASGARLAPPDRQEALIAYTERMGFPVLEYAESPKPEAELDRTGRDVLHGASTPAMQAALLRTFFSADVTHLLPAVTMPVTILHGTGDRLVPFAEGRALAARLPQAEFVPIDGNTGAALTEREITLPAIRRALGVVDAPAHERARTTAGTIQAILFTDLVGHTEMMQRLGDTHGREVLREHERITREALARHGGTEIKTDGDSFMASFASVTAAVDCAVALQRAFAAREGEPLQVRIGLNAGEPVEDGGDLFGASVILAARIKDRAGAGEILIPEPVRHLLAGKGFAFADRGEFVPKGFDDAVRLFEVRWHE